MNEQQAFEILSQRCREAFEDYVRGADRRQRVIAWDAFRNGWLAHQMAAAELLSSSVSKEMQREHGGSVCRAPGGTGFDSPCAASSSPSSADSGAKP